jgi:hypothetical protein
MRRRALLKRTAAVGAVGALAGCFGVGSPPPRESEVFEQIAAGSNAIRVSLDNRPMVESMAELNAPEVSVGAALAALSPIGVASAGGNGGRGGRSGGGRSAGGSGATGRHGRHKYGAGGHTFWHATHGDQDIDEYRCDVARCGAAYLAPPSAGEGELPGPGPVNWDESVTDPSGQMTFDHGGREGWWRVGGELMTPDRNHSFGWEAVDFRLNAVGDDYSVRDRWKVSPPL